MLRSILTAILIIVVASLSTFSVWNSDGIHTSEYLVLANSAIGVIGAILLLCRLSAGYFFFVIWVLLQLAVVGLSKEINLSGVSGTITELNFTQFFFFPIDNATLELSGNMLQFNLIPLGFLLLFLIPGKASSGGKSQGQQAKTASADGIFELRLYRWNQRLEHNLPQKVKVVKRIDFKYNKNWFLVRLSKPFKLKGGVVIKSALIKPKDGKRFYKDEPGQMGYFRLVRNEKSIDLDKTPFIDWVLVK